MPQKPDYSKLSDRELLIRLDERSMVMKEDVNELEDTVSKHDKDITKAKNNIALFKWLGTVGTGVAAYFKWGQ